MARAIAKAGFDRVTHGASPVEIRRGLLTAIDNVCDSLTGKFNFLFDKKRLDFDDKSLFFEVNIFKRSTFMTKKPAKKVYLCR